MMDVVLASFKKHIDLNLEEEQIFKNTVEVIEIDRRQYLLKAGQICRYEYFVLSGCIRSYYTDEQAIEHTTMFATEGWWTGNLKSFVRETPSDFHLEAVEQSRLIRISKPALDSLYERIPKLERYFRILLQNRLLSTQDRINNHLSSTARERYAEFLNKYPSLIQRVPLKHIASFLGITPTYLSRLRAQPIQD